MLQQNQTGTYCWICGQMHIMGQPCQHYPSQPHQPFCSCFDCVEKQRQMYPQRCPHCGK